MAKKIDAAVLTALIGGLDAGVHIGFRDEIRRIDGPFEFDQRGGGKGASIKIVFASGFTVTSFQGDKFFEAFRRLPVGDMLSYTYEGQRDARPWNRKKTTDSGAEITEAEASNGDLDGFEVFEHVKGTTSEIFAGLLADENAKPREITARPGKPNSGSVLNQVTDLESAAAGAAAGSGDLPAGM